MRKLLLAVMMVLVPLGVDAQITVTNSFSTGQVITAASMNTNFQTDLGNKALNRTGGTVTGNIVVDNNITIDGVDVSDYLATNVYAQDAGAAGDPSFSWVGDTDNGMFLGGTNIVDFATAGFARVRIAADGTVAINSTAAGALDVAGGLNIGSGNVALVDDTGQITSLDTEYLVDLTAEDLTNLNASALTGNIITSGTGPHAIGGGTTNHTRLMLAGSFTSGGASNAAEAVLVNGTLTGHGGDSSFLAGVRLNNAFVTAVATTTVAQLYISEPNLNVSGGAVTNSAALYINSVADEATNDYAIWVDAGASRFDGGIAGNFGINTSAPQSLLDVQGSAGAAGILHLATQELTVVDGDVLGRINFNAPLESSGSDAILVGAAIWAEADDTFTSTINKTELVFATNNGAAAIERMRLDADGNLVIGSAGTLTVSNTGVAALDVTGGITVGSGGVQLVGVDGKINGPLSSTIIDDLSAANLTSIPGGQITGAIAAVSGANLTTLNASNISSGTLAVARGGTGASTLTDGGILLGSGSGAITALGAASNGQIPIGDGTTDPVLATLTATTNETTITNGSGSITVGLPDDVTIGDDLTVTGDADIAGELEFGAGNVEYVTATYTIADDGVQAIPTYGGTLEIYRDSGDYYCMFLVRDDNEDTAEILDNSSTCSTSQGVSTNTNFYYASGYKLENTEGGEGTYYVIMRQFKP